MGWSSANPIFDSVVWSLVYHAVPQEAQTNILDVLIMRLQEADWDTEDESLHEFKKNPAVVEAFRRNGITLDEEDD